MRDCSRQGELAVMDFVTKEMARINAAEGLTRAPAIPKPECCPQCKSTALVELRAEWKCQQCGHQFGGLPRAIIGPSRREVLRLMNR
jgi:ribosomal protein L37AE/L43A